MLTREEESVDVCIKPRMKHGVYTRKDQYFILSCDRKKGDEDDAVSSTRTPVQ
jgi:hypothetical protein